MTTIYVTTSGQYSDYHITGVWSTRDLAEEYNAKKKEIETGYSVGHDAIEEHELDGYQDYSIGKKCRYLVRQSGDNVNVEKEFPPFMGSAGGRLFNRTGETYIEVDTDSEESALKIAAELRTRLLVKRDLEGGDSVVTDI